MKDTGWRQQAVCVGLPTKWWFESENAHLAQDICTDCPAKVPCVEDALANPTTHGIWGGHSFPSARQRLLKIRRAEAG
ncbi:WhiB family transcriptional regulator [Ferrimicrobium sp.]|uniref:WhiB family transcriptional regulator n=1 Tax=Ferrimicrobium sp. TaxID=2926050 RepID=UPI0034DB6322